MNNETRNEKTVDSTPDPSRHEGSPFHPSIGVLIHLGAGLCGELDAHLSLKPERILLVEADPALAASLEKRTAGIPQAEVRRAAVAARPGPAVFFRYNLPDAGSLHRAAGLLELYPGLRIVERLEVETVSPAALLQPLRLEAARNNHLIVDIPGEELPVLDSMRRADQLHLFSRIRLYCGRESLYEGDVPAIRILEWLHEAGFDLLSEEAGKDPDRPCWTFHRNTLQLQNRELRQRIETLESQAAQLARAREEKDILAAELKSEVESLRNRLAQLQKSHDEQAKAALEGQSRIEQLTKEREEQAGIAKDRLSQLEQASRQREESAKLAEERQAQILQLAKSRDENANWAKQLKSQVEALNGRLA
ncbi:MAG: hypothetical protein JW793_04325, partial [Acidobacteria bacterium]|nr:hypothetical protein [Acidobacteriota bacterium]